MKDNKKKSIKLAYLVLFAMIACITLCIIKGHRSGQYYKQYGSPQVKKDDLSGRMHTPYLSLPKGDYELIVGYFCDQDLNIKVGNEDAVLEASKPDSESFMAFNVTLAYPSDDFCLSWTEEDAGGSVPEIYEYELKMTKPYNNDAVYIGLLFFILCTGLLCLKYTGLISRLSREDTIVLLIVASATVFSSLPLFRGYLVYGHDLMGHLKRIEGLRMSIYDGHLIPLVYPGVNNGYGEAAVCYPYLFLYIPAFLRLLNISMPLAYNTLLFLLNLGTGIFSCLAFRALTKDRMSAAIGAFIYLLIPYRLEDLYVRAALGESIAMTFLPLILWGTYEIIKGDKKKYYILSLGFLGLLSSHVLSTGLSGLFVLFMTLVFIKPLITEKRIISLLKAGAICLLAAIPEALLLRWFSPYTNLSEISVGQFHRYSLYPAQLFMNDASVYTLLDLKDGIGQEMTQGIGLIGGVIFILIMLRLFRRNRKNSFVSAMDVFALIFIYATTTLCPWNYLENLPVLSTITGMLQFPLRFLSTVSLILAAEAAFSIKELKESGINEKIPYYIPATVLLLITLTAASTMTDVVLREDVLITDIDGGLLRTPYTEYYPADTPAELFSDTGPHAVNASVSEYKKQGNAVMFSYEKEEGEASVLLPLFNFPGYHAADGNGNKLQIKNGDSNRVEVVLPEASGVGSVVIDNSIF